MEIKIAIVDDHEIFRDGLCSLLARIKDLTVIGLYSNGQEFLKGIETLIPDIVLMDIEMPLMDGETTTKILADKYPEIKVIALSLYSDFSYYNKMLNAGVKGFVLKQGSKEELEQAIFEVYKGNNYFSQVLLHQIISDFSISNQSKEKKNIKEIFSEKELKIIGMICKGLSNKEMSKELFISQKTVESYKTKLFYKLGVKNTVELVIYMIKNKIIDL
jgi:DNA-binding NarL/FixJ family response regulator